MIVQVENNITINTPKTYLSASISAGTNVIGWKNPNGFQASWGVQIGNTGEAQSEIVLLGTSTPSGTAGTLAANTLYDHPADTPIYAVKYDQLVFARSTTGTTGVATALSGGTITIQPNGTITQFDDTSGSTSYAYATWFRNSILAVNSTQSDWITFPGLSWSSLGKIRQRVKDKLVSAQYISGVANDDSMINDWINEWLEVMQAAAIDVNEDYAIGTTSIAFSGTTELGTITNSDFRGGLKRVWYSDGSGTYVAQKMDSNSFSPNKTFTNTYPYFFMQGDNVIGRRPFDTDGTFICEYSKTTPVLVEDTDTLPLTMTAYTKSFVDYGHAQALFKDQKIQEANLKLQEASGMLQRFKLDITPRNRTGATYMDIVEDTAQDQELWL